MYYTLEVLKKVATKKSYLFFLGSLQYIRLYFLEQTSVVVVVVNLLSHLLDPHRQSL